MDEDVSPYLNRSPRSVDEFRAGLPQRRDDLDRDTYHDDFHASEMGADDMSLSGTQRLRMPVRSAAMVWFGAAMVGWVVLIVAAYSAVRFGDQMVASIRQTEPSVIAHDGKSLSRIAPAAGGTSAAPR